MANMGHFIFLTFISLFFFFFNFFLKLLAFQNKFSVNQNKIPNKMAKMMAHRWHIGQLRWPKLTLTYNEGLRPSS